MATRQDPGAGLEVSSAEAAVSPRSGPPARRPVGPWVVAAVVVVLAVGAVVAAGLALGRGADDAVVAEPADQSPARGPVVPAPLTMTVVMPASVVAGRLATIEVRYAGGHGQFGGSTEDWGDGVGTSSLRQGACDTVPAAATPLSGSYRLTHTWDRPGTYTVQLGVSAYACAGASAVEEQAGKKLTVTVAAR